jgi:hypothetical protein
MPSMDALGPTVESRMTEGKALRENIPRRSHAQWAAPADRVDPIDVLKNSDRGRLSRLLPIRYGRMRQSPFAFFRGSAALMALDLAKTPVTDIRVQACGIANDGDLSFRRPNCQGHSDGCGFARA